MKKIVRVLLVLVSSNLIVLYGKLLQSKLSQCIEYFEKLKSCTLTVGNMKRKHLQKFNFDSWNYPIGKLKLSGF